LGVGKRFDIDRAEGGRYNVKDIWKFAKLSKAGNLLNQDLSGLSEKTKKKFLKNECTFSEFVGDGVTVTADGKNIKK